MALPAMLPGVREAGFPVETLSISTFWAKEAWVSLGRSCTGLPEKSQVYALKAVDKKRVLDHKLQDQLVAEVNTQMTLSHPNLLRCFDCFLEENTVYIVLEVASNGDLYQSMKRQGPLRESDAAYVFKQVCDGVQYLHNNGIIHRDLKRMSSLLGT